MNTTDYDKIADDLHRKSVADRFTAEEIAQILFRSHDIESVRESSTSEVLDMISGAVRIARGEVEIP